MSIVRDLPWGWIAGVVVALGLVVAAIQWRQGGERRYREHRSGSGSSDSDSGHGQGSGMATQTGEQRALLTAANAVRDALDRQVREMGELRAFWSNRLDDLDKKIAALSGDRKNAAYRQPGRDSGEYVEPLAPGMYGAGSLARAAPPEPAWSPGPSDQPVEVRDGVLVVSRSLPPAGYVSASGSGQARVYLNADVPLTEFSLPKWAVFFELQGAKPYAAYRTRRPAEVRWDEGAGRGELISKGMAEAI